MKIIKTYSHYIAAGLGTGFVIGVAVFLWAYISTRC